MTYIVRILSSLRILDRKGLAFLEVLVVVHLVWILVLTFMIGGVYEAKKIPKILWYQAQAAPKGQAPENGRWTLQAAHRAAYVMKCKNPYFKDPNGKIYKSAQGDRFQGVPFGCGQCMACRINKVREWQHKIMLEATSHKQSAFVTLTFRDEEVPEKVTVREVQLFVKRMRKYYEPLRLRFFAVGEYGDRYGRPHYHLAVFGVNDSFICPDCDKDHCPNIETKKNLHCEYQGKELCIQEEMMSSWTKGIVQVGEITKESAGYIAGYAAKGMTKAGSEKREFILMSKYPPLGTQAVLDAARHMDDVPDNQVVTSFSYGRNSRPLGRSLIKILMEARGQDPLLLKGNLNRWQDEVAGTYSEFEFPYAVIRDQAKPACDRAEWKYNEFKTRCL